MAVKSDGYLYLVLTFALTDSAGDLGLGDYGQNEIQLGRVTTTYTR